MLRSRTAWESRLLANRKQSANSRYTSAALRIQRAPVVSNTVRSTRMDLRNVQDRLQAHDADLGKSSFSDTKLLKSTFVNLNMQSSSFTHVNLSAASFTNGDLSNASIRTRISTA